MTSPHAVLIVDADPKGLESLVYGFQGAEWRLTACPSPETASLLVKASAAKLVVIASRREHERMHSLVRQLRGKEATRALPILVLGPEDLRATLAQTPDVDLLPLPTFVRDVLVAGAVAVAAGTAAGAEESLWQAPISSTTILSVVRTMSGLCRSGQLRLERNGRVGEILFHHGELTAASVGPLQAMAAVQHLMVWHDGKLELRLRQVPRRGQLRMTAVELLQELDRFERDYAHAMKELGQPTALVVASQERLRQAGSAVPAEVTPVVRLCDGKRPLADVIDESPFRVLDTVRILGRLAALGILARPDGKPVLGGGPTRASSDDILDNARIEGHEGAWPMPEPIGAVPAPSPFAMAPTAPLSVAEATVAVAPQPMPAQPASAARSRKTTQEIVTGGSSGNLPRQRPATDGPVTPPPNGPVTASPGPVRSSRVTPTRVPLRTEAQVTPPPVTPRPVAQVTPPPVTPRPRFQHTPPPVTPIPVVHVVDSGPVTPPPVTPRPVVHVVDSGPVTPPPVAHGTPPQAHHPAAPHPPSAQVLAVVSPAAASLTIMQSSAVSGSKPHATAPAAEPSLAAPISFAASPAGGPPTAPYPPAVSEPTLPSATPPLGGSPSAISSPTVTARFVTPALAPSDSGAVDQAVATEPSGPNAGGSVTQVAGVIESHKAERRSQHNRRAGDHPSVVITAIPVEELPASPPSASSSGKLGQATVPAAEQAPQKPGRITGTLQTSAGRRKPGHNTPTPPVSIQLDTSLSDPFRSNCPTPIIPIHPNAVPAATPTFRSSSPTPPIPGTPASARITGELNTVSSGRPTRPLGKATPTASSFQIDPSLAAEAAARPPTPAPVPVAPARHGDSQPNPSGKRRASGSFSAVESDFFAREADLYKDEKPESFADLDTDKSKPGNKAGGKTGRPRK